ncbi:Wzz/FepE/Etk N-terminal domain-containing protein [Pseudaquabacterium pictum]|uniref:Transport-related membrane protein n=1 Tax=Pseudaquabacterium pictum TaxID=2315236 RepID=A0A480AXG3_9BURK|nr:Wzz/FepE/Etk N-terminal domain-containing protein [Rubrivivax pictus]GCL63498.1 transport-related membrane protein [Rubrivivax pictus]
MSNSTSAEFDTSAMQAGAATGVSPAELLAVLGRRWKLMLGVPLLVGCLVYGYTLTLPKVFTASTTLMPPQQSGSGAGAALASLGSLGGALPGGIGNARNVGDQYVALLESATVADRIIDQFKLNEVYGQPVRAHARQQLASNTRIALSKSSGLVSVDVSDTDPKRAANLANQYVAELRRLNASLALTEAQRRRMFFEKLLAQSRDRLTDAQRNLQASGFNAGVLRSEPKTTAETYSRLQLEVAAAEVQLQALRDSLTDSAPEVQRQQATLAALRRQLTRSERPPEASDTGDYIARFRDYKYQETLFDLYARQFEVARADESRESDAVQVIDVASPPEIHSGPRKLRATAIAMAITAVVLAIGVLLQAGMASRRTALAAA